MRSGEVHDDADRGYRFRQALHLLDLPNARRRGSDVNARGLSDHARRRQNRDLSLQHEKRDELRARIKEEAELEEEPRLGRRRLRDVQPEAVSNRSTPAT